jgi:hypothetical protein
MTLTQAFAVPTLLLPKPLRIAADARFLLLTFVSRPTRTANRSHRAFVALQNERLVQRPCAESGPGALPWIWPGRCFDDQPERVAVSTREGPAMSGNAQLEIIAPVEGPQRVDLIYLPPLGDFRRYEARLRSVAGRFGERIRFTRARARELFPFMRAQVFLSKTVPNIVVVRSGAVVAHAVGELPARELEAILAAATRPAA